MITKTPDDTGSPLSVGLRIKAVRLALGYKKAKEFAATFGATGQQLSNYEKGVNGPSIWQMRRLALRHNITLDWIYLEDPRALQYHLGQKIVDEHAKLQSIVAEQGPESDAET